MMEEEKGLKSQEEYNEESPQEEGVEVEGLDEKKEEQKNERKEYDVEILLKEIDELKKKCDEYKDNWIRTAADFDNYRKRIQKEKEEYIEYGNESILKDFLTIVDDLERALDYIKSHSENAMESLLNGVELIHKQMLSLLEKYGVKPIEAIGKKFDPFYHEVVEQEEVEEGEEGVIMKEYQKGYMYKSRVLRPSRVVVAKVKEKKDENQKVDLAEEEPEIPQD